MFAYVDESGNTGANLFDPDQPLFLTAALVTKADFDVVRGPKLRAICNRYGVDSLHASVLGFGPIEKMAPEILKLLKEADAHFFISRVEKRYLLATKIFDTFFDSGENPAVPWSTYNVRPLRLIMTFKVAYLLDREVAELFWAMLMAKSEARARKLIPAICDSIIGRVNLLPDARSQQIITEALGWTKQHPEALDLFYPGQQAKNGHMPNMVAFMNLLDGLQTLSNRWKRSVRRIRHDRQSQFEATLAEWHRMVANAPGDVVQLPGETRVFQRVPGSDFEVSASDDSPGIQIADLILWLFRQFIAGKEFTLNSAKLLSFAMKKGWQNDFSFDGVNQAMTEQFGPMLEADLTDEQMLAARDLQQKVEQIRLHNLAAYEVDGLMPYQRGTSPSLSASSELA